MANREGNWSWYVNEVERRDWVKYLDDNKRVIKKQKKTCKARAVAKSESEKFRAMIQKSQASLGGDSSTMLALFMLQIMLRSYRSYAARVHSNWRENSFHSTSLNYDESLSNRFVATISWCPTEIAASTLHCDFIKCNQTLSTADKKRCVWVDKLCRFADCYPWPWIVQSRRELYCQLCSDRVGVKTQKISHKTVFITRAIKFFKWKKKKIKSWRTPHRQSEWITPTLSRCCTMMFGQK